MGSRDLLGLQLQQHKAQRGPGSWVELPTLSWCSCGKPIATCRLACSKLTGSHSVAPQEGAVLELRSLEAPRCAGHCWTARGLQTTEVLQAAVAQTSVVLKGVGISVGGIGRGHRSTGRLLCNLPALMLSHSALGG